MGKIRIIIAVFAAAFFMPAHASEFKIERPSSLGTVTMPCWSDRKLAQVLTRSDFDAVATGLMIKKTDASQPLVSFWLHMLSGRGLVTVSRADGEECILAVVENAE
tara:strand:- start:1542 stop:1859 length:318 start_codon:yes stop_codon:yes gene_type:complete